MSRAFVQRGDVMTFTAPGGGVTPGTGVLIGKLIVIPQTTASAGASFDGYVTGVCSHAKADTQAWTEGQVVYWDDSAKVFTTVSAGNTRVGVAAAAVGAGAGLTTGLVRLNAIGGPKYFSSTEQTGTGSAQNVAHGLGLVPEAVVIWPTDLAPATTGAYTVTEGTHTTTNVVVTVTTGKKFKVFAFA